MGKGLSVAQLARLRAWQKRESGRRCSVAQLSVEIDAPRTTVTRVLKERKLQKTIKKVVLKEKLKKAVPRWSKKDPHKKPIRVRELQEMGAGGWSRQWVSDATKRERKKYRSNRRRYWLKWHRDNPNNGIDEQSQRSLEACQRYW